MKKSTYGLIALGLISIVILAVNILAYFGNSMDEYLYVLDIAYVIGNSAHLVALSLSSNGLTVRDET